ncbi:GNAT family N-acetyltransferase [Lawsonibacter sp. LCP25S3_G6]|uniref:GNAT family N-acetyltransferase n=1 Tax=unclassified Lawsonibacter TaxID=2617946 RepID=UPI003F980013
MKTEIDKERLRDAHQVFCKTFNVQMTYDKFYYKHYCNPEVDMNVATFVRYENGIPCGTNSFMSGTLYINESAVPVTYSCDTAVLPEFRGRGIFTSVVQEAIQACKNGRPALICAAPNSNSYRGFQKLGFTELFKLQSWSAILHPVHLGLRKKLRWKHCYQEFREEQFFDRNGNCWESFEECPFTDEEIQTLNERSGICLGRSRAFYQWKVDQNSDHNFLYWKVTKDHEMVGFFLLKRETHGSCCLCDWWINRDAGRLLKTLRKHSKKYADVLNVLAINPESKVAIYLKKGGFFCRIKQDLPFMIYNTGADAEVWQQLNELQEWQIYQIDFDTILN